MYILGVYIRVYVQVYTFLSTLDMCVYIHPCSLHTMLSVTKRRSVTQLRFPLTAGQGRFSAMRVSPTAFGRCFLGPLFFFFSVL